MEKLELDRRDPVAYEAPVLEPARVRFGAQERNSPGDIANILCNECNG
jgi:hypothetical protein